MVFVVVAAAVAALVLAPLEHKDVLSLKKFMECIKETR
jgi:hypothetical protein